MAFPIKFVRLSVHRVVALEKVLSLVFIHGHIYHLVACGVSLSDLLQSYYSCQN